MYFKIGYLYKLSIYEWTNRPAPLLHRLDGGKPINPEVRLWVNRSSLIISPNKQTALFQRRHSPTLKPCPMSVSAPCPFSAISVVLLPCSQVSWHCPFRQIRLQMRGAMTTLKRSVHHTSLWTLSQMTSRWEIREGILASFTALHKHPGTLNHQQLRRSAPAQTRLLC